MVPATRTFHIRFRPPFLWIFVPTALIDLIGFGRDFQDYLGSMLIGLVLAAALGAIGAFILMRFFAITVGEQDIEAHDFWGRRRSMRWDQVAAACRLPVIEYLRLRDAAGGSIYMPLLVENSGELFALMRGRLPENHLLSQFVRSRSSGAHSK